MTTSVFDTRSTPVSVDSPVMLTAIFTPKPCSYCWSDSTEIEHQVLHKTSFCVASPLQIMPFPLIRKASRVVIKQEKTVIITLSSYKNELNATSKKRNRT